MGRKSQSSILQARTNSKLSSRHSNRLEDMTNGMTGNSFSFNDSSPGSGSGSGSSSSVAASSSSSYFFSSPSTASFFSSAIYSNQSTSASNSTSPSSNSLNGNIGENLFNTIKLQNQPQSQLFNYRGSTSEKKYPSQQTMCYSNSSMTTRKEIEKSSVDDKSQFDVIYTEVTNNHFLVYNLYNKDGIIT